MQILWLVFEECLSRIKVSKTELQCSPFKHAMFGVIGMVHVVSESCLNGLFYKGIIGK